MLITHVTVQIGFKAVLYAGLARVRGAGVVRSVEPLQVSR
jgi:hypothetical protein